MEDEDGEGGVVDMCSILGEQEIKESILDNTLNHTNDDIYTDQLEEEKDIIQYNSIGGKDSPDKNIGASPKIVFKGFKKRILAQAQESQTSNNVAQEQQPIHVNISPKNNKEKRIEGKRGKITEYAQYLGLQPASKHKCSKCHSATNVCSTLKQAQCTCNSTMAPMQGLPSTSESSALSLTSNFKISRKVYLCAACGTYFENWNLFLHMRDIHKRHICLFCLGMFGQAERLSYHLAKKHSVPEIDFTSVEEFYSTFKGSCYLVCCTCEKVFSETDNFYNHFCSPPPKDETTASTCTLCRQTGSHASTCSLAIEANSQALPTTPHGPAQVSVSEKPAIAANKGAAKKIMRNNRTKHMDDSSGISHRSKFSVQLKRTNSKGVELYPVDNESSADVSVEDRLVQDDSSNSTLKDTVSETIMEVSKYLGDSSSDENESRVSGNERISNETLDSVTQTIMEVSRVSPDVQEEKRVDEIKSFCPSESNAMDRTPMECENNSADESVSMNDLKAEIPVSNAVDDNEDSTEENEKVEDAQESKADTASHASSSPPMSPVNRSLFSPQHEVPTSDILFKEEHPGSEETKGPEPAQPTESQTSVSFNRVTTTDRSLVIKICANKNSQFSVTAASAAATNGDDLENQNVSRESEENNNGEESASEDKLSNASEADRCSVGSDRVNDDESDSDSDKLAVVDNNADEAEIAKDVEEPEAKAPSALDMETNETKPEDHVEEKQADQEETGTINTDPNGEVTEPMVNDPVSNENRNEVPEQTESSDGIVLAGEDVPSIDLNVEGTLESMDIESLLKGCIEVASPFCVYCNHARHIAVNGKQLGLHMLAEHKFQPQHPAIIIQPEQFVGRVKKSMDELENRYFNLSSYSSVNGTYDVLNVRTYECFHCRFHSAVHKELYLHNRKMHQKTILICIMCKSTFYSYSELLCHLCPGIYSPNINVKYRCCLCPVDGLPSAFRLMVHLRKRHHACDVCLESTGNQQRLSNHVWKHKLHHLCYRCGIAYRNKPDITKHLFWKHGTESVLCKKCLQKKWPHIYHFCIPPTAFVCEECGSSFSRAVALKVHKRLHSGDQPYSCQECLERFISHKLLARHEKTHRDPSPVPTGTVHVDVEQPVVDDEKLDKDKILNVDGPVDSTDGSKEPKETVKKVVDVYDLPPLNLSSESDTDSEDEKSETTKKPENGDKPAVGETNTVEPSPVEPVKQPSPPAILDSIVEAEKDEEEKKQEERIMDGIWDNFKTYAASLEMQESGKNPLQEKEIETDVSYLRSIVLADHDYCVVWSDKGKKGSDGEEGVKEEVDAKDKSGRSPSPSSKTQNAEEESPKKKAKSPKKKKQGGSTSSSDSSSDSDSSSCSCGTNCSCSSSSSGSTSSSSSSSDSDSSASESSPRKQSSRKDRKKEKDASQETKPEAVESEHVEVTAQVENGDILGPPAAPDPPKKMPLRESDLETDETDTDEDFYDEHPQQLANKILAEKRNQLLLLAAVAPASAESTMSLNNGITDTDSMPAPSPDPVTTNTQEQPLQQQQKKKVKTKKRKRGERTKQRVATPTVESIKLNIPKAFYQANSGFAASSPSMMTLQTSRSSTPILQANESQLTTAKSSVAGSGSENENKRSSKRKRVPKRFYGDSSDEEADTVSRQPATKWRKVETPTFARVPSPKRTISPRFSFSAKNVTYRQEMLPQAPNPAVASATESEDPADSSSDSSDTEIEASTQQQVDLPVAAQTNVPPQERTNLYCYCQCPYDEVSEMIACDGEDCRIEWFHFECVGIMVPPKGKWYCPDCRKKHGISLNSEDYFD